MAAFSTGVSLIRSVSFLAFPIASFGLPIFAGFFMPT